MEIGRARTVCADTLGALAGVMHTVLLLLYTTITNATNTTNATKPINTMHTTNMIRAANMLADPPGRLSRRDEAV